jgi:hypothetical protein
MHLIKKNVGFKRIYCEERGSPCSCSPVPRFIPERMATDCQFLEYHSRDSLSCTRELTFVMQTLDVIYTFHLKETNSKSR